MRKILFILLLLPVIASSQTRLYLNRVTTSPLTPTPNANWDVVTSSTVGVLLPYVLNDGSVTSTSDATGAAAVRKIMIRQFVTPPLLEQTLNGTFTGQIKFNMSSTTSRTGEGLVYLRLINADGTVASEVGSLTTTAMTTTATNRTLIALTLSSVNVTAGQRICIDIGWNYSTGSNTATTGTIQLRSARQSTDLPVDNTTTTTINPWVEFSQTIKFQTNYNVF